MASTSETSFGARLRKAQDLLAYISGFTNYNPPRQNETVASMTALINSIVSANSLEASHRETYRLSVDRRHLAYFKTEDSVDKLLSPIRGAVEAHYGKKSIESTSISAIIKKIRASKVTKAPADPSKEEQEKSISQSERSYGSIAQYFNDIINSLSQFSGYNPSNSTLKVANLQLFSNKLTTYSNEVAKNAQTLKTTKTKRLELYAELKDRVQRIKSYVKAQYGNSSSEYELIKGLSI